MGKLRELFNCNFSFANDDVERVGERPHHGRLFRAKLFGYTRGKDRRLQKAIEKATPKDDDEESFSSLSDDVAAQLVEDLDRQVALLVGLKERIGAARQAREDSEPT